ncbi:MAG TPA: hypothetical protein VGN88_03340 [Phycisphaerae bacterium]|jgi:hypothetical protein
MTIKVRILLAAALLLSGANFCHAADQIDNPQYKSWAKYKAGTSITLSMVSDMAGNKTEMQTTTTLLEITADKAVVESKMSMNAGGQKMDMPATKTEVAAKIDKPAVATTAPATTAPDVKQSTDTLTVSGTAIKCNVTESKSSANGMNTNSKVWTSDQVPGGLVKSETTMDGAMKGTTSQTLTAMTIK